MKNLSKHFVKTGLTASVLIFSLAFIGGNQSAVSAQTNTQKKPSIEETIMYINKLLDNNKWHFPPQFNKELFVDNDPNHLELKNNNED